MVNADYVATNSKLAGEQVYRGVILRGAGILEWQCGHRHRHEAYADRCAWKRLAVLRQKVNRG